MASAAAPGPRLDALEAEISRRSREFEISALLDLLDSIGYGPRQVEFRGHLAHSPQPTLIHAIEFPTRAAARVEPKVVITVNLGLLSCRSPLPSYFRRYLADMDTRDGLLELLELLDCSLLHTRLTSDRLDRTLDDWEQARRDFVRSFGLDSPLGLEWLFRRVFPELGVRVRRVDDAHDLRFNSASLGLCKLGECSFGPLTRIGIHDIEVTLICEDASYHGATSWVREGDRRLRGVVFPLLDELCMTLTVSFVLLDRGARAQLSPHSYAGYDPMWADDQARPPDPPGRVQLYRGLLPREEPDTAQLELELELEQGVRGELSVERYAPTDTARALGQAVALQLVFVAPGRRYAYEATIHWGARAWYRDEPRAIELRCQGVRKTPPTLREHPRLWARLRDEARGRIADRLTHEVLATAESERVTLELIDGLIACGELERLHALVGSEVTPMAVWDDEAWRRFADWSAG